MTLRNSTSRHRDPLTTRPFWTCFNPFLTQFLVALGCSIWIFLKLNIHGKSMVRGNASVPESAGQGQGQQRSPTSREEIFQIHTIQRSPTAVRDLACAGDSLNCRTGNSCRGWCIATSHFQCCGRKNCLQQRNSGVTPTPFRQDILLCPRRDVVPWLRAWETLTPQPRLQIDFLSNAQELIASRRACHPVRAATLVEMVPSLNWMWGTTAEISHNESKTGVDGSEPAAAHIKGTLMGDHSCWRTTRGTKEPTATAPTRLANSWKRTSAARTWWCLGCWTGPTLSSEPGTFQFNRSRLFWTLSCNHGATIVSSSRSAWFNPWNSAPTTGAPVAFLESASNSSSLLGFNGSNAGTDSAISQIPCELDRTTALASSATSATKPLPNTYSSWVKIWWTDVHRAGFALFCNLVVARLAVNSLIRGRTCLLPLERIRGSSDDTSICVPVRSRSISSNSVRFCPCQELSTLDDLTRRRSRGPWCDASPTRTILKPYNASLHAPKVHDLLRHWNIASTSRLLSETTQIVRLELCATLRHAQDGLNQNGLSQNGCLTGTKRSRHLPLRAREQKQRLPVVRPSSSKPSAAPRFWLLAAPEISTVAAIKRLRPSGSEPTRPQRWTLRTRCCWLKSSWRVVQENRQRGAETDRSAAERRNGAHARHPHCWVGAASVHCYIGWVRSAGQRDEARATAVRARSRSGIVRLSVERAYTDGAQTGGSYGNRTGLPALSVIIGIIGGEFQTLRVQHWCRQWKLLHHARLLSRRHHLVNSRRAGGSAFSWFFSTSIIQLLLFVGSCFAFTSLGFLNSLMSWSHLLLGLPLNLLTF